jgi:hypothetical protein
MTHENVEGSQLELEALGGKAEFRICTPKVSKTVLRQTADRPQAISPELKQNGGWIDWPPSDGGTS